MKLVCVVYSKLRYEEDFYVKIHGVYENEKLAKEAINIMQENYHPLEKFGYIRFVLNKIPQNIQSL